MQIPEKIFKSYDIRGIYPIELNEENISEIVRAIFKVISSGFTFDRRFKFGISHDMRLSSPSLYRKAIEALSELDVEIYELGLLSTPSFYFATLHLSLDGGFTITASHNPKEYNGLKIVKNSPEGIIKIGKLTGMEDIKRLSIEGVSIESKLGSSQVKINDILQAEIENALTISGNPEINKFKIVADPANAMGAIYLDEVFKIVPAELIKMNFELDGNFPSHQPDPLQSENLVDLQKRVIEEKADLGLAPDGDGDRLFFIDEKGNVVPPSIITSLVAKEMLKKKPGSKILFDIRYIFNPKKIVEENGGESVITKVGHAFISEKMREVGGVFAGESSGHYFFKETGNAESQLPVVLTILKVMTEEKKPLSEIVEELRRSFESGEINFEVENGQELIEKLKENYQDAEISILDGAAIIYPDRKISLRSSNTEPLIRLNIEAYEKEVMEKTRDEVIEFINQNSKE